MPFESSIPLSQQALIEVFQTEPLASTRFPDVDAAVLEAAAEKVRAQSEAVRAAEIALASAQAALQETQDALLQKCQRALAYARVFADENPDLLTKLESIALSRPARRTVMPRTEPITTEAAPVDGMPVLPKKRGRPAKASSETLFQEPEAAAAPA